MLEIIPVLDLMNSVAVSGKSGNRDTYTPLQIWTLSKGMGIIISIR